MNKIMRILFIVSCLLLSLPMVASAEEYSPILDDIDLLNEEEESHFEGRIAHIAEVYDYHIIFNTTLNTTQFEEEGHFGDYFGSFTRYDGEKDGVIIVVSPYVSPNENGFEFGFDYVGYGEYSDLIIVGKMFNDFIEMHKQIEATTPKEEKYFAFFDSALNIFEDFLENQHNPSATSPENYVGIGGMINGFDPMLDAAEVMTEAEEELLFEKIEYISKTYDFDVTLMTMNEVPGDVFLLDYFDWYTGLDYTRDGAVFGIDLNPENRDYATSTRNLGIPAFTADALELIDEEVAPLLTAGKYFDAYDLFLDHTITFVEGYKEGNPYEDPTNFIIIVILAPFILAIFTSTLIVNFYLVPQMKTAVLETDAERFVVKDSLVVTSKSDVFTHKTKTSTKIESSSSGGSGGTRSGYGGSRGGGSGKF